MNKICGRFETPTLFSEKKHVRFFPKIQVRYIPNRDHLAKLDLWWTAGDYTLFSQQSNMEIQIALTKFPNIRTPKMARHILYQPESLQRIA
jgi:hypothetical protein